MLTESDRKLLTEYLEEPFHELRENPAALWDHRASLAKCSCGMAVLYNGDVAHYNRTFLTIQDFYDLKCKMVERGEWEPFVDSCVDEWEHKNHYVDMEVAEITNWFIHPDRCKTVADWLRGRER